MIVILRRLVLILALCVPGLLHAEQAKQGAPPRDNSKFVVFIHAGGKAIDGKSLRQIAIALSQKGYVVRAPDKDRDEVGGPGVDYFSDTARDAAQDVAEIVNEKLKELKMPMDENKKLKPRLQRLKNPAGYLGVWLF